MSGIELWAEVLQWVVLGIMAFMVLGSVYLLGDINRRLGPDKGALVPNEGLEIGTAAPEMKGIELRTGLRVNLADARGRTAVVAFLSQSCGPCRGLVPDLNRLATMRRDIPFFVVALNGSGGDYPQLLASDIQLIADVDDSLQHAFLARYVPLIYVVDADGAIKFRAIANDLPQLEDTLSGIGFTQDASQWAPVATAH